VARCAALGVVLLVVTWNVPRVLGGVAVHTTPAAFSAAAGPTRLIDFDTAANGSAIGDVVAIDQQYAAYGVDINPFNGGSPATLSDPQLFGFNALSAPNQVETVPPGSFFGGGGLEVVFAQPTSAVALYLGDVQFPGSTLTLLNAAGEVVTSFDLFGQLGPSGFQWKFLGIVSTDKDISRLRLAFAWDDYITIDNLQFATSDVFRKVIVAGPDRDGDQQIDRAILEHGHEPSEFTFAILFDQPQLGGVCIEDCVPYQWEVINCTPAEPTDLVLKFPTGKDEHGHLHYRDTQIQWYPSGTSGVLTVTVRTRPHSDNRWEPHNCMCLLLNKGAAAVDSSTGQPFLNGGGQPLVTNRLFVAALHDKNHDGVIDYSGNGDEDNDGLTDYFECELGTDPCNEDTDGDHVNDGVDPAPLDRNVW